MLKYFNFYSPEDGGAGAAAPSATNDDLFEAVNDSDAGSNQQPIDGMKAVNTPDSEGKPLETNQSADDEQVGEDFDSLIKGRYKKEYQAKVDGVINKRFKNNKQNEEKIQQLEAEKAMLQPLFQAMGARYGIDPSDVKAIVEAADKDNSNFENEAFEKGFSDAAQYRQQLARDQELNRLRESERVRIETETANRQRQQLLEGWIAESSEFKKEVPEFDFKTEWESNEKFKYLVNSGFSVRDAYRTTHYDEVLQAEVDKAKETILREVRTNQARPIENTIGSSAAIRVKKSIKDMSLEDTDRIIREAKLGKKITF